MARGESLWEASPGGGLHPKHLPYPLTAVTLGQDMVAIALGCSFSFEAALLAVRVPGAGAVSARRRRLRGGYRAAWPHAP